MTSTFLHVLNGDAVIDIFKKTQIPGDIMVWREVLCTGPTHTDLASLSFRDIRADFFADSWDFDKNIYRSDWLNRLNQLENFKGYEIVLWFEYDLFCQINFIAGINLICQICPETRLSFICAGLNPSTKQWETLGILSPEQWIVHFQNRTFLTEACSQFAQNYWQIYCSHNHQKFLDLKYPKEFPYLEKATESHFRRFPSAVDGLNEIERHILLLLRAGDLTYNSIMRDLFAHFHFIGYGDKQYESTLKYLENQGLIIQNNHWSISSSGEGILKTSDAVWRNQRKLYYGGLDSQSAFLEDFKS